MTLWKMRGEWAEARGQRFDVIGSLLYGLALLGIMYGFRLLPAFIGIWVIVGGALFLAAFVLRERRIDYPVLDVSLFSSNIVFALSNLSALINYAATYAVSFLLSLFLQYVKEAWIPVQPGGDHAFPACDHGDFLPAGRAPVGSRGAAHRGLRLGWP